MTVRQYPKLVLLTCGVIIAQAQVSSCDVGDMHIEIASQVIMSSM